MNNICIIPARGGSKRIPGKNIKDFLSKPIIAYSIEAALNSNLFNEVMVSTDDLEIARISKKYGASVPFMRSEKNSDDFSTTYDVIKEVIDTYKKRGVEYEYTCCLYPTAPFVTLANLRKAFDMMGGDNIMGSMPVVKYSYPIQRALFIDKDSGVKMNIEENLKVRSQDLKDYYHDAGQFYFYKTEEYLHQKSIFKMNIQPLIISEIEAQDIDTDVDWKLAELKYKLVND